MGWLIEQQDNGEEGTSYHLFEQEGDSVKMRAILFDNFFAQRVKAALNWQDSLGSGLMSLSQDGITIDAKTGRVNGKPKRTTKQTPARKPITKTRRKA